MKRQGLRFFLAVGLVVSTLFLGMLIMGSYESSPDPKARFEIQAIRLKQDKGYVWLEAHLKKNGKKDHDLKQPVRLVTADGVKHEPADSSFAGTPEKGFTEIWFKFWLETEALKGEINLEMNGGALKIKSSKPLPVLGSGNETVFKSSNWETSWLGF
jgi:hypothetical protein